MKWKTCLVAVALMLAMTMSCFASLDADPFQEGAAIIVSGVVENGKAGVPVTVLVPKANVTADDLKTKPLNDIVYYIGQTTTVSGGAYRFEIFLGDGVTEDTVLIRVGENDFAPVLEANITYTPTTDIIAAVEAINGAAESGLSQQESRDKMAEALKSDVLGLEITGAKEDYEALADKNIALDYLIEKAQENPFPVSTDEELTTSIASIRTHFKTGVGLAVINASSDAAVMNSKLNQYADVLGLDLTDYNALDNGAFGDGKAFVCGIIYGMDVQDVEGTKAAFDAAMALLQLNQTVSWEQVKDVLAEQADALGFDMGSGSDFSKIDKKDNFYKDFAKKVPFETLQEAAEAFEQSVDAILDDENTSSSGGGGSSSGGGGGGRPSGGSGGSVSTITTPPVVIDTPDTTENVKFDDLSNVPWAVEAIEALTQEGILNGVSEHEFAPEKTVTRAEFLKMVMTAFDLPVSNDDTAFTDVTKDDWYYGYVVGASSLGIVSGYGDGAFGPNDNITRQDMAVILVKALQQASVSLEEAAQVSFADDGDIDAYAKQSVYQLANAGVINGKGDNLFVPKDFATRAEAAVMIYKIGR